MNCQRRRRVITFTRVFMSSCAESSQQASCCAFLPHVRSDVMPARWLNDRLGCRRRSCVDVHVLHALRDLIFAMGPSSWTRPATRRLLASHLVRVRVGVGGLWYLRQIWHLHQLLARSPRHFQSTGILLPSLALLLLHSKIVDRDQRMESIHGVVTQLHSLGRWCVQSVPAGGGVPALVEVKYAALLLDLRGLLRISPLCAPDRSLIIFRLQYLRQLSCDDIC